MKRLFLRYLLLALFLSVIAGCFYEELSWSPDGRYLAYAAGDRGALWRWDSATRQCEKIEFKENTGWGGVTTSIHQPVKSCRYLARDTILFMTEVDNENGELYLAELSSKNCRSIAKIKGPNFDVSSAGNIYYISDDPDLDGITSLIEHPAGPTGGPRTLLTRAEGISFVRSDPDGARLAYCDDTGLHLFDLQTSVTTTALPASDAEVFWPTWLNDEKLLLIKKASDSHGDLLELNLDGGATRRLAQNVSLATAPTLNPGGRTAAFSARRDENSNHDQVAALDIESGRLVWLTDEIFGAGAPAYSPDGASLAFLQSVVSQDEGGRLLKVLDVASGRVEVIWRTDEERLYAGADTLARAGAPAQALAGLQDLLRRYPETDLQLMIRLRMMMLYLEPPLLDLDQAWECWREIAAKVDTQEMPPDLAKKFWRAADRLATDPAGDWITAFNTPEASKSFNGANTDEARDLRALWARAGKDKLYLRVDIGGKAELDPSGIALQDTLILIRDAATSDTAPTALGPRAEWRHTARRQILVRHWAIGGPGSQYDLEIRDEKGEVIHRFLAAGFAPPRDPLFDRLAFVPTGETRGAIYAVSRELLGLKGPHKLSLQVVTLKGGIDPRGASELSAESGHGIADAFGPANDPAKIRERAQPDGRATIEDELVLTIETR